MIQIRQRVTSGVTRERLRQEGRRSLRPLAVSVVGFLVGLLSIGWVFAQIAKYSGAGVPVLTAKNEVRFAVDRATGVVPGRQEARISGLVVGRITDAQLENGQAVVTVAIQDKYGEVYRDAQAELRPATALNEIYLDITDRGSRESGVADPDEPIPAENTETTEEIGDILNTFDGDTRERLRGLLSDFGSGLDGRGDDLNAAFVELVPFVRSAHRLTRELAEREGKTRRLVRNASLLTAELGRRQRDVRTVAQEGAAVLNELADRSGDLGATIEGLPPTLSEADATLAAVSGVLPSVDTALVSLDPVADRLPAGVTALDRLSRVGTPAVRALRPSLRRLRPLARALVPATRSADVAVRELLPQTGAIDKTTGTLVSCRITIDSFFQNTMSLFKFGDAGGASPRGEAVAGGEAGGANADPTVSTNPSCAPGQIVHPKDRPR